MFKNMYYSIFRTFQKRKGHNVLQLQLKFTDTLFFQSFKRIKYQLALKNNPQTGLSQIFSNQIIKIACHCTVYTVTH